MTSSESNVIPSWKRPWSIAEIIEASKCWSLAADAGICELIKSLSTDLLTEISQINNNINELSIESRETDVLIQNAFNDFCMLANDHFMENLVEEVSSTALKNVGSKEILEPGGPNKESKLAQIVPQVSESIKLGLLVLENQFEVLEVQKTAVGSLSLEQQFDDGDDLDGLATTESTTNDSGAAGRVTVGSEAIYQPRDPYEHRHLPHLIGTSDFVEDDTLGIGYLDDLDELKSASIDDEIDEDDDELHARVPVGAGLSSSEDEDDSELDELERHGTVPVSMSTRSKPQTLTVKARQRSSSESPDLFADTTRRDSDLDDIFETGSAATQQLPENAPPRQLTAQEAMHRQLQERLGLAVSGPERSQEEARASESPVNKPVAVTLPTAAPRTQRLFSMDDDDSDGDLFSPSISSKKNESTNPVSQGTVASMNVGSSNSLTQLPARRALLLSTSSSDDDIFSDQSKKRDPKKLAVPTHPVAATLPNTSVQNSAVAANSPRQEASTVKRPTVPFLDTDSDDDDIFAVKPVVKKDAALSSGVGRLAAASMKGTVADSGRIHTNGLPSEPNKTVPKTRAQLPLSDSDDEDLFNPNKTTLSKLGDSKEDKSPKLQEKIPSEPNKTVPKTRVQLPLSDSDDEDLFNPNKATLTKLGDSKEDKSPKLPEMLPSEPNKTVPKTRVQLPLSDSDDEDLFNPNKATLTKLGDFKEEKSPKLQEKILSEPNKTVPKTRVQLPLSDSDDEDLFNPNKTTLSKLGDSKEDKRPKLPEMTTKEPIKPALDSDDEDHADPLGLIRNKPISSKKANSLKRSPITQDVAPPQERHRSPSSPKPPSLVVDVKPTLPLSRDGLSLSDSDSDSIFGNHTKSTDDSVLPSLTKSTVSNSTTYRPAESRDDIVVNGDKKLPIGEVQTVQPSKLGFLDDDSDSSDQLFGPAAKTSEPTMGSSDSKSLRDVPTTTQPETEPYRVVEVDSTPLLITNTSVPEEDMPGPMTSRPSTRKLPPGARNLFGTSTATGASITDELVFRQNQRRSMSSQSQATDDEVMDIVVNDHNRPTDVLSPATSSLSTEHVRVTTASAVPVSTRTSVTATNKISELQSKLAFGPGGLPIFPGGMPSSSRRNKANNVEQAGRDELDDGGEEGIVKFDEPAREVKQLVLLTKGRARNMPRRRPPTSGTQTAAARPSIGDPNDTHEEVERPTTAITTVSTTVTVPPPVDKDSPAPDKSEQQLVQQSHKVLGPASEEALESSDIFANLPSRPERKSKSSRSSNVSANRKQSLMKQGASKVPVNVSEIDDIFAVDTRSKTSSTTSTKKTKSKPVGKDPLGAT